MKESDGPTRREATTRRDGATASHFTGVRLSDVRSLLLDEPIPASGRSAEQLEALREWRDALVRKQRSEPEDERPESLLEQTPAVRADDVLDRLARIPPLGTRLPDFHYYGRAKRFLARLAARSVLFLARIVTAHQRIVNELLVDVVRRTSRLGDRMLEELRTSRARTDGLERTMREHATCLLELEVRTSWSRLRELELEETVTELEARLERRSRPVPAEEEPNAPRASPREEGSGNLESRLDAAETRLRELERRISTDPVPPSPEPRGLEDLHLRLAADLRGSPELVRERVLPWVELATANGAGSADRPILDLGCGRGEWLEVLAEHGLRARGVDTNRRAVEECRARELTVTHADALEYLRLQTARSAGMISAFHVVEHLPFEVLVALLDEIHRVLAPGGVVLLETPNPENLLVAGSSFHCDPTHRTPLHPQLLAFVLRHRGFVDLDIRRLTESRPSQPLDEIECPECRPVLDFLRLHFTAASDYAVLGLKPGGRT